MGRKKAEAEEGDLFVMAEANAETEQEQEKEASPLRDWTERFFEFEITVPSGKIKDTMKEELLREGWGKRDANKVFRGLFFKEKVCNTKEQAEEYLAQVPTSYAVKYKIGIEPSPAMVSLKKRLEEKRSRLRTLKAEQKKIRFGTDFVSCPHCKSRVNRKFITPPLCPVCGEDMRSDSAVKRITALEAAAAELKKRYEDTARKYNSRFTGGERWIIRLVNPFTAEEEN